MKKNNSLLSFRFLPEMPSWYLVTVGILCVLYLTAWGLSGQVLATSYHNAGQISASDQLIIAAGGDSGEYVALAASLLHGYFALPGEAYEYFRTPGYPGFVAAVEFFGGPYLAVTVIQIFLAFVTAMLIFAVGKEFFGTCVGIAASLIFLLNPLVLLLSLQVMSDLVFTFLLFLGVSIILLLTQKSENTYLQSALVFLVALIFSAATYVRPAGVVALPLYIAPILATSLSWNRKLWYSLMVVVVFVLALIPWMYRNYEHSNVFSFSSLAAYNLTAYNVPMFEATQHHDSDLQERVVIEKMTGVPLTQWRNLSSTAVLEHYDETALLQSPVKYVAYHLFESTGFFVNSGLQPLLSYMSGPLHYVPTPTSQVNLKEALVHGQFALFLRTVTTPWWICMERIMLGLGIVLIAFGLFTYRRTPVAWLAAFSIVYFAALSGPVAEARYRLPADPFFELLIASGVVNLWNWVYPRIKPRLVIRPSSAASHTSTK